MLQSSMIRAVVRPRGSRMTAPERNTMEKKEMAATIMKMTKWKTVPKDEMKIKNKETTTNNQKEKAW